MRYTQGLPARCSVKTTQGLPARSSLKTGHWPVFRALRTHRTVFRALATPGGKSAKNEFLLPDGKLTSAKILLGPAKPVLRISLKGAQPPSQPLCLLALKLQHVMFLSHMR